MTTEKEIEAYIDEAAVQLAVEFLDKFPKGFLEDAVYREVTYIGRITALFEEKLRELIPYRFDPEKFVPVLEGTVISLDSPTAEAPV